MDIEKNLISKVLHEKDTQSPVDAKITTEFFLSAENRVVWDFILGFKADYGSTPTLKVVRDECDGWKPFDKVEEPFEYLIEKLREQRKRTLISDGILAAGRVVDENPDEAQGFIQHALAQVGTEITTLQDENLTSTGEERLKRYEELENLPDGLLGIPTGFRTIDRATGGLQKGQLITLIGPPKAGKSTTLLAVALAIHQAAKRPLFIGFEMSNQEQEARYDAMLAKISYKRLTTGKLTSEEKQRLNQAIMLDKSATDFVLSADISATTTLAGIGAKVDQYMPDVVIIDGVYMMETPELPNADPGSPQSLTYLTRNLKRMAQSRNIPVVISTQVLESRYNSKKGLKSKDIGYSSSFAQDSDVVLGVEQTDDEYVNRLRVVIARNSARTYTDVRWDWDKGTFEEAFGGDDEQDESDADVASAFD